MTRQQTKVLRSLQAAERFSGIRAWFVHPLEFPAACIKSINHSLSTAGSHIIRLHIVCSFPHIYSASYLPAVKCSQ